MAIEKNNKVTIEYEGRFDSKDGEIFDSSEGRAPLVFVAGVGMVVPGFDNAVLGMEKDEEKEIVSKPAEAYGERREELKQKVPRSVLPKEQTPKKGMMLMMATPQGQQMPAKIVDVSDEDVTIDINHPLAGKTLYFKIKVKDFEEVDVEALAKADKECECSCSEDDACKTGEEDCKCEGGDEVGEDGEGVGMSGEDGDGKKVEEEKEEVSIEDLAEGK